MMVCGMTAPQWRTVARCVEGSSLECGTVRSGQGTAMPIVDVSCRRLLYNAVPCRVAGRARIVHMRAQNTIGWFLRPTMSLRL